MNRGDAQAKTEAETEVGAEAEARDKVEAGRAGPAGSFKMVLRVVK